MGLFGSKKISYLGVDLGAGGIKLLELQNEKGRGRLTTYGFTERPVDMQPINLIDDPKFAAETLKKIASKARTTTVKAVAGVPVASVFSAVITVPKTNEKEQREAIEWQARKLIPVPLEEMVLDSKRIMQPGEAATTGSALKKKDDAAEKGGEKGKEKGNDQFLITGTSKAMVQKYLTVFKTAGFELASLEPETFALVRSLIGKDRSRTMIVDMGAVRTNIVIVENGVPFVTRSLDMGGASFTKAMAATMAMEPGAAEKMKTDIKSVSQLYPDDKLPKIFENTIAPMMTELQYSMNLYVSQNGGDASRPIEKVIITGGSAGLPALASHIAAKLNVRAYVGDPWARVVYPEELRPVLDEIGPRYAVAIGLAMRDIE
jgi:type IV pilus assembly protein PilM